MQCALGMAGALSSLTSKKRPLLFVTRQLTELVIMSGFKRVRDDFSDQIKKIHNIFLYKPFTSSPISRSHS